MGGDEALKHALVVGEQVGEAYYGAAAALQIVPVAPLLQNEEEAPVVKGAVVIALSHGLRQGLQKGLEHAVAHLG